MDIQNLIFLDLETTRLFEEETPELRVKIAEIAMIAVRKRDFLQGENGEFPMIAGIWSTVINPMSRFSDGATRVNGFTNEIINRFRPFSDLTRTLMQSFFRTYDFDPQLRRSCLIAHNGNAFDFRLLRRELNDDMITKHMHCFDTLVHSQRAFECSPRSLANTYREKFGGVPTDAHRAIPDAMNLLKIAAMTKRSFIDALELNKIPF